MADVLQLLVAGLATGGIYALVAIGFALMWQTSQTINFAQGEFVMLPAFFMLAAMRALDAPFWAAVVIGIVLSCLVLGLAFKTFLVDPMLRHGVLPLAIATMALALFLRESVKDFYGAEAQPFPPLAATLHGLTISPKDEPGILIETTWDDKGDIDRISFIAEVINGKQQITGELPKLGK